MRKVWFVAFVVALTLFSMSVIAAEGENWCDPGQPWGDGRCESPDPNVEAYNWKMGWLMAHKTNPSVLEESTGTGVAVDDEYMYDRPLDHHMDCRLAQTIDAEHGLLANDFGSGLVVASYTQPGVGEVVVWDDGSFRYKVEENLPSHTSFFYTLSGGSTAQVKLHLTCEKMDDEPK